MRGAGSSLLRALPREQPLVCHSAPGPQRVTGRNFPQFPARWLYAVAILVLLPGCHIHHQTSVTEFPVQAQIAPYGPAVTSVPVKYRNVTAASGIHFQLDNGARGEHRFIETTTGGCALFDYNNDGYLDIFLIQAGPIPGSGPTRGEPGRRPCALYRNNGDGSFADVTREVGLNFDQGYAQGVAVGDYDNDGWEDLYITSYGGNHLLRNEEGRFVDVTRRAGVADNGLGPRWSTSAAWAFPVRLPLRWWPRACSRRSPEQRCSTT